MKQTQVYTIWGSVRIFLVKNNRIEYIRILHIVGTSIFMWNFYWVYNIKADGECIIPSEMHFLLCVE